MAKWDGAWNKERLWSQESPSLWSLTSTPPPLDISVLGHQGCLLDKVFRGMTKRSWKDRTVVIRRHDVETDRDLKFSSFMSCVTYAVISDCHIPLTMSFTIIK